MTAYDIILLVLEKCFGSHDVPQYITVRVN